MEFIECRPLLRRVAHRMRRSSTVVANVGSGGGRTTSAASVGHEPNRRRCARTSSPEGSLNTHAESTKHLELSLRLVLVLPSLTALAALALGLLALAQGLGKAFSAGSRSRSGPPPTGSPRSTRRAFTPPGASGSVSSPSLRSPTRWSTVRPGFVGSLSGTALVSVPSFRSDSGSRCCFRTFWWSPGQAGSSG
jgi:hypothetical protein